MGVSPLTLSHQGGWRLQEADLCKMLYDAPAPEGHCQGFLRLP